MTLQTRRASRQICEAHVDIMSSRSVTSDEKLKGELKDYVKETADSNTRYLFVLNESYAQPQDRMVGAWEDLFFFTWVV